MKVTRRQFEKNDAAARAMFRRNFSQWEDKMIAQRNPKDTAHKYAKLRPDYAEDIRSKLGAIMVLVGRKEMVFKGAFDTLAKAGMADLWLLDECLAQVQSYLLGMDERLKRPSVNETSLIPPSSS